MNRWTSFLLLKLPETSIADLKKGDVMSDSNNSEVGVAHFYVRSSTAWRQVLLSQSVLLSIPHGVGIVHTVNSGGRRASLLGLM